MNIMEKLIYTLFTIYTFLLISASANAQTCNSNFTVNTQIKNSTCLSNGEIAVILSGDTTNLFNIQYGLSSESGFSINPQSDHVLRNIPPGTYQLTVRAFCKVDSEYDVVKNISNLVVGGNYKVPKVSFNSSTSRKSYAGCNTGIIALNVTDGSGTFSFTITSAPAGITTPIEVVPTKNGSVYTLPGSNYPAGDYIVMVDDGCYTAACNFSLEEISGFPPISTSYSSFLTTFVNYDYNNISWAPGSVSNTTYPDYYRYYSDGMYEVGIAPKDSSPTVWSVWNSSARKILDISPYTYKDLYGTTDKLYIYTRIKGCPDIHTSSAASFRTPSFNNSSTRNCGTYSYTVKPWTDYDGLLCYPLSILVTETSSGNEVLNKSNLSYVVSETVQLQYSTSYSVKLTDANGHILSSSTNMSRSDFSFSYTDDFCNNQYKVSYSAYEPCYPIEIEISDPEGNIVCTNTLTGSTNSSCYLEYGKSYSFKAIYKGSSPKPDYSTTISRTTTIPTSYTLTLYSSDQCSEDRGYLRIYKQNGGYPPAGTTYTINGPTGYITQTGTISTTNSSTYASTTYLPAGTYTVTIINGCGDQTPIIATVTLNGIYSGKKLDYTTEITCAGLKLTPSGYITYQGNDQTAGTFYRLTNGPTGYDKTVKKPGEAFILSSKGTYTLGIMTTNSTSGCVINTVTIDYTAPPLDLNPYATSAYVCVGGSVGNISVKAINGVAPYTYELWNKTNTIKESISNITTNDIAHFSYGEPDSTYTVRISDVCGNKFSQQMTLAKLSSARVVYSVENNLCTGSSIQLKCITLGETNYNWTGPNNFTSNVQNPEITNATANMSGWYKVSVMPEFCGTPVLDSVFIRVYPPITAGATVGNQELCVRTKPAILKSDVSGGSGAYTYQWQSSANGTSGWTNIQGATTPDYESPTHIKSGTYYYRKVTTDRCGVVYSDPIAVVVKACYIPVNPDIRNIGIK